ncbi:MAG: hypothetical protein V4542_15200 [Pseudomonadota bacterium]
MDIAGPHTGDMPSGMASGSNQALRPSKLPVLAGLGVVAAVFLFMTSWLLPAELSLLALDLMSWCLVGALAAGTLYASVKLIENVLNF